MNSFQPQLAHKVAYNRLDKYIQSSEYYIEQKLDGVRLVIGFGDNGVVGYNRKGAETDVRHEIVRVLTGISGTWAVDGEWVNGEFWAFDLPIAPGIDVKTPYGRRREALEIILPPLAAKTDKIRLLPTHKTPVAKAKIALWCVKNNAEGVIIKDVRGWYTPGMRSENTLKAKLTTEADVVVTEVGRGGKRSIGVALYEDGNLVDVGSVTVTDEMLGLLQVGDVCEVRFLYSTVDQKLYQPRMVKRRLDKDAKECTTDQLKLCNKTVLETPFT